MGLYADRSRPVATEESPRSRKRRRRHACPTATRSSKRSPRSSTPTRASTSERGFQRRIGFGSRPALVHIDLANAWTRPGHAFSCDGMDVIIPAVQRLNEAGRAQGRPDRLHDDGVHEHRGTKRRHRALALQDPRRTAPRRRSRGADRRSHRSGGRRPRDREEARERIPRHQPLEPPQRPRRRHRDPHRRDDGGLRAPLVRGCDCRGLPADRRARGRR